MQVRWGKGGGVILKISQSYSSFYKRILTLSIPRKKKKPGAITNTDMTRIEIIA